MPNDSFITDMDPVLKLWMFYNWLEDQKTNVELAKNHAILLGSFWNPEAAKSMLDDNNNITISDDDFEDSMNIVKTGDVKFLNDEIIKNKDNNKSSKRRRKFKV